VTAAAVLFARFYQSLNLVLGVGCAVWTLLVPCFRIVLKPGIPRSPETGPMRFIVVPTEPLLAVTRAHCGNRSVAST